MRGRSPVARYATLKGPAVACRAQSFEDQLGLVLSPKSKIEDGSGMGTLITHVTAVADFPFRLRREP